MRDGHQGVARYPGPCQVRSPRRDAFPEWLITGNGASAGKGGRQARAAGGARVRLKAPLARQLPWLCSARLSRKVTVLTAAGVLCLASTGTAAAVTWAAPLASPAQAADM